MTIEPCAVNSLCNHNFPYALTQFKRRTDEINKTLTFKIIFMTFQRDFLWENYFTSNIFCTHLIPYEMSNGVTKLMTFQVHIS